MLNKRAHSEGNSSKCMFHNLMMLQFCFLAQNVGTFHKFTSVRIDLNDNYLLIKWSWFPCLRIKTTKNASVIVNISNQHRVFFSIQEKKWISDGTYGISIMLNFHCEIDINK
jgi:hypothetical protein